MISASVRVRRATLVPWFGAALVGPSEVSVVFRGTLN